VTIRAALVGAGAWGKNLARVVARNPRAQLVAIADPIPARRALVGAVAPEAVLVASIDEALGLGVDAVLIAAPPELHAALVGRALAGGADVFVEKPMATRLADAERCAARAKALGRVAMVGHLMRYHPTVERLIEVAASGEIGRLLRVESVRRSVAGDQRDRSLGALWALGPHDFSVIERIDASPRVSLRARVGPSGDPVDIEAELASGLFAEVSLARAALTKERRIRIAGRRGSVVFDDVLAPDRLFVNGRALRVPWEEPLAREVDHFFACIEARAQPRTSFEDGLTVVRALAEVEASIAAGREAASSGALLA